MLHRPPRCGDWRVSPTSPLIGKLLRTHRLARQYWLESRATVVARMLVARPHSAVGDPLRAVEQGEQCLTSTRFRSLRRIQTDLGQSRRHQSPGFRLLLLSHRRVRRGTSTRTAHRLLPSATQRSGVMSMPKARSGFTPTPVIGRSVHGRQETPTRLSTTSVGVSTISPPRWFCSSSV